MTKNDDLLAALGRFSEPALHILISLADGPKHGYAITQDIESLTGQKPGPGTLYGAIARLEARKWIEPLPVEERRRPYRLTASGQKVLKHRLESLRTIARIGRARLAEA
ncbi:MAG TPA: PadR family transcriptional regulator [Vicinamibacterales bacterium]|nr:PadR family transcriptional regulator [Vicinamibacterales bacterium]